MVNSDQNWVQIAIECSPELIEPVWNLLYTYTRSKPVIELTQEYSPDEGESLQLENSNRRVLAWLKQENNSEIVPQINAGVELLKLVGNISDPKFTTINSREWIQPITSPIYVGDEVAVVPPELADNISEDKKKLVLNPGLAFGTGNHPTTYLMLKVMQKLNFCDKTVLDAGCGSGILSILAGKLGAKSVAAIDIESQAIEATQNNIAMNDLATNFQFYRTDILELELPAKSFDLILTNISSKTLISASEKFLWLIKSPGYILISGYLAHQKEAVLKAFNHKKVTHIEQISQQEWFQATLHVS